MQPYKIDAVEIVEPPIEELSKRPSVWKRACALGCFGLIIIVVGFFVLIKLTVGPGPEQLRSVPASFPNDIPLYDKQNIERITFVPGRFKNRAVEIAAIFPKIILAPLFISLEPNDSPTKNSTLGSPSTVRRFWKIISTPVSNARDTVQIEWNNIAAEPLFVYNYYRTELRKKNYTISAEIAESSTRQFSFSGPNGVGGFLIVRQKTDAIGTEYALLMVNLPSATSSPQ